MSSTANAPTPTGIDLDEDGRCVHWNGPSDVVAIRLPCCSDYYACRACHDAVEDHPARIWPRERFQEEAVLCGSCRTTMTIAVYLDVPACPACGHAFNPRCRLHRPLYFEVDAEAG